MSNFDEALTLIGQGFALLLDASRGVSDGTNWPPVMGRRRACEYLDIGETKFGDLVKSGDLPEPVIIGGKHHWHREDLDRLIRRASRKR